MDCAIWLNRSKIFSADEIPANFDIAAIRGYFLGGSLIKWLAAHGGQEYLPALEALSPSDSDLNNKLTEIFAQKKCTAPVHKADETLIRTIDAIKGVTTVTSSGYEASSFAGGVNSFYYGSFNSGSYNFGSYYLGSFSRRTWQWEWEWRYGSFRGGSFGHGSFAGGSGIGYGSFRGGSFNFGSFGFGSFRFGAGSYRFGFGFDTGSYRGFPLGGSFRPITTDEYDEIMYRCLNMCPLNRFGYGIHLI